MMTSVRWILFLPLALLASVLAGALGSYVAELIGSSPWYVWCLSGGASGAALIEVSFRVAPRVTALVKWLAVGVTALIGALAAIGPLLSGNAPIRFLAGAVMVYVAWTYARRPISPVEEAKVESAAV